MNPAVLSGLAALLYLAAAGDEFRKFKRDEQRRSHTFIGLVAMGLALHWCAASLAVGVTQDVWSFSLGAVTSLGASMVVAVVLYLRWRQPLNLMLTPLIALIALVTALSLWSGTDGRLVTSSLGMGIHIVLSLAAFAILFIGGVQALLLGWQNHALKTHQLKHTNLLPPITRMERLLFDLIGSGWLVLTASLVSGWLFVEDLLAQHLAHKTLLSLLAWAIFACLLIGRRTYGWRGFTAAAWTLAGFGVLLLGTLGTKIILELVLDRI
ncbi:MAG: cytochrome C assembly family protein [Litorivicinus sp.]